MSDFQEEHPCKKPIQTALFTFNNSRDNNFILISLDIKEFYKKKKTVLPYQCSFKFDNCNDYFTQRTGTPLVMFCYEIPSITCYMYQNEKYFRQKLLGIINRSVHFSPGVFLVQLVLKWRTFKTIL
jgi:hypothetical protein